MDNNHNRWLSSLPPPQAEWVRSIVGRDWEIFWKQPSTDKGQHHQHHATTATTTTAEQSNQRGTEANEKAATITTGTAPETTPSSDPMVVVVVVARATSTEAATNEKVIMSGENNDDDDDERDGDDDDESSIEHEEDWYDARIVAFSRLEPPTTSAADDNNNHNNNNNRNNHSFLLFFRVSFVGDDVRIYEMELTPELVRPSARAWIRRSRALLEPHPTVAAAPEHPPVASAAEAASRKMVEWEQGLPPDTHTLDDSEALGKIEYTVKAIDFPPLPLIGSKMAMPLEHDDNQYGSTTAQAAAVAVAPVAVLSSSSSSSFSSSSSTTIPSWGELEMIRRLILLLRFQQYLRTRLAPIVVEEEADANADDDEPTEEYINHLVGCLKELEQHCAWYYQCWEWHVQIFSHTTTTNTTRPEAASVPSSSSSSPLPSASLSSSSLTHRQKEPIDRNALLQDGLQGGRRMLISLATMDCTVAACKRKRRRKAAPEPVVSLPGTRRTKRQRKSRGFGDSYLTINDRTNPEDRPEDHAANALGLMGTGESMLSNELVTSLVDRFRLHDDRFYANCMGNMLSSLSCHILAPLIKWQGKVEYYLGNAENAHYLTPANSDDDAGDTDDDDDEASDNNDETNFDGIGNPIASKMRDEAKAHRSSTRFISYEDIQAAITLTQQHDVLKHIRLSDAVRRLQDKLDRIDDFTKNAWNCVNDLYNEPETIDPNEDEVMHTLVKLHKMTLTPDDPVSNVDPLGPSNTPLTRNYLQNLVVHRHWLLSLKYAESTRERVSFIERVVEQSNKLPRLPTPPQVSNPAEKLILLLPRLTLLSTRCTAHTEFFNQYKLRLNMKLSGEGQHLCTMRGVNDALDFLGRIPVVAEVEELIAVRKDILVAIETGEQSLKQGRPSFERIVELQKTKELILDGRSATRLELVRNLRKNPVADAAVREFAAADLDALSGPYHKRITSLYQVGLSWMERAEAIVTTLRFFGNPLAGEVMSPSAKPQMMIDLKRITDLLGQVSSFFFLLSKCVLLDCRIF